MRKADRILVVEENPTISRCIDEKFTCERATDGWDAIEKLENQEYDAIIIDADVPRQSGYGVLTYLREEIGEDLANVIVMTSSDCDDVRRRIGDSLKVVDKQDAIDELSRVLES